MHTKQPSSAWIDSTYVAPPLGQGAQILAAAENEGANNKDLEKLIPAILADHLRNGLQRRLGRGSCRDHRADL
jgi:hypothetical protein